MPPKPLPGLSFEQIDSSAQIEPSKKRKTAESANVNTIAKRPKPDELATGNPAHDASRLAAVTDDLNTVISGLTELFSTMKLLLGRGNFSDVEELATQAPDFLKRLQILLSMQSNQFRKIMQRGRKFEEEAAEREKLRTDREGSLRVQLAASEATERERATGMEILLRDVSGVKVFRAMLNNDEVTVSFTTTTERHEAVVTIHYADRRKLVWHNKLDKCVVTVKWDWILCLDQGPGRPGMHLHHLIDGDVAELPLYLMRDTEWGSCYCGEDGV